MRRPEVRGDGVPMSDWFVVWRAFRVDQRLDAFDEEICNCEAVAWMVLPYGSAGAVG